MNEHTWQDFCQRGLARAIPVRGQQLNFVVDEVLVFPSGKNGSDEDFCRFKGSDITFMTEEDGALIIITGSTYHCFNLSCWCVQTLGTQVTRDDQ